LGPFCALNHIFHPNNALTWLEDAGLICRAKAVETAKHPLKHYTDTGIEQALKNSLTTPS